LAIHSVIFAFSKPPTDTVSFIVPGAIVLIFLSVWAWQTGNLQLAAIYPFLMAVIVIGRILLIRMVRMDRSLEAMQLSYKQSIGKIITFDYKLAAGVVLALVAIALAIYLLLISPLISMLMGAFSDPPNIEFVADRGLPETMPHVPQEPSQNIFEYYEPRTFRFWDILSQVILGILSLAVIVIIIYGLYRFALFLLSYKVSRKNTGEDFLDLEDEREFIPPPSKNRRGRFRSVFADLHPVRRLFKETAKKHVKMGVPIKKSDTPSEITKRIRTEDISTLTDEYTQIRYK
jgi:hypothetical protein